MVYFDAKALGEHRVVVDDTVAGPRNRNLTTFTAKAVGGVDTCVEKHERGKYEQLERTNNTVLWCISHEATSRKLARKVTNFDDPLHGEAPA